MGGGRKLGHIVTEETREKLRKALTGRRFHSEEFKKAQRERMLGNKRAEGSIHTEEWKENYRKLWQDPEFRQRVAEATKDKRPTGERHFAYKGDKALIGSIHKWMRRYLGKAIFCTFDKSHEGKLEWASISHQAKRDLNDYMSLCIRCHRFYDKNPIAMRAINITNA